MNLLCFECFVMLSVSLMLCVCDGEDVCVM